MTKLSERKKSWDMYTSWPTNIFTRWSKKSPYDQYQQIFVPMCSDWTLGTKQISGHKLPLAYKSPWYMTRLTRISTLHHTLVSLFRGPRLLQYMSRTERKCPASVLLKTRCLKCDLDRGHLYMKSTIF